MNMPNKAPLRVLHSKETKRIHNIAMRILADIGVLVKDESTRRLLTDNGCYKKQNGRISFTEKIVQKALSSAPAAVELYRLDGEISFDTAGDKLCLSPGSNCMAVLDYKTGSRRPCLLSDVSDTARVCDRLSNVGLTASLGWPSDVLPQEATLKKVRTMVKNCRKPVSFTVYDDKEAEVIWGYLSEIAGGWGALAARPTGVDLIGPDSPLQISRQACGRIRFAAGKALPVICYSGLIPGLTGPMTLAGSVAQSAAEALSCLVVHQLENPGAPFITGSPILPMDMRTCNLAYGSPMYSRACLACVDYYTDIGLPNWTGAGCSDAHRVDAQAVAEVSMGITAAVMSGANFIHNLGFLSSGKTGSLEMLVLGNELAETARWMNAGVATDSEAMGIHVIERVLSDGGSFLDDHHTVKHVRTETATSPLFDRISPEAWFVGPQKTVLEKIHDTIEDILKVKPV